MNLTLELDRTEQLSSVCGSFDRHLETISKSLDAVINNKGEEFALQGSNKHIAVRVLQDLVMLSQQQMKAFLTHLDFSLKMVITGDITQIDLANPKQSGLIYAAKLLINESKISFYHFETKDMAHHNLVQRIASTYDKEK